MKKNLVRLFAAAMGAACMLSLAACGGNNASKAGSDAPSSKAVSSAASQADASAVSSSAVSSAAESTPASTASSSADSTGSIETVEDYINSGFLDAELDGIKEEMASSGMDVDITAKGNQLTYTFTYQDTEGVDPETLGSILGTMTDSMAETFEGMAAELAEAIESDDASVVVTYVAEDGTELYSQEFFPTAE